MERVIDIENKGDFKIYTFSDVANNGVINDQFKEESIVLFHKEGTVSI